MVPIPESMYFPALDKCLNGEVILVSWERAFTTLSTASKADNLPYFLRDFFNDPVVSQIFSAESGTVPNAFLPPTQRTKAAFETKTSAINVTPSSTRYDINEVKEDALWLSTTLSIDEIAALRVVVIERQSQPSAQLLGPFSLQEVASIREACGNWTPVVADGVESEALRKEFGSQTSRRSRLRRIYLSEKRNFWKCLELMIRYGSAPDPHDPMREIPCETLFQAIGQSSECILSFIETIRLDFECLARPEGSEWLENDGGSSNLEIERVRSLMIEIIQAMGIVFCLVFMAQGVMQKSTIVRQWFRMLSSIGYLAEVEMQDPSVQALIPHMRILSSMTSVTMLSLEASIAHLENASNSQLLVTAEETDCAYLKDPQTVIEIHKTIRDVASCAYKTTGPLVLAWSKILKIMRQTVTIRSHERQRYEINSIDAAEGAVELQEDDDLRRFEVLVEEIFDESEQDTVDELARSAVNGSAVFEVLNGYALRLDTTSSALFPDLVGSRLRVAILCLIRDCGIDVGYIPEIVTTALSALGGSQNCWDFEFLQRPNRNIVGSQDDPVNWLLEDASLIAYLLDNALHRFPYEATPYLKLIRSMASCKDLYGNIHVGVSSWEVVGMLEGMPSFTVQLPDGFSDYQTIDEEDNTNDIQLLKPLQLFQSRLKYSALIRSDQANSQLDTNKAQEHCIPAGTRGRIVTDQGPKVAYFLHRFSAFKYLGKLLETYLSTGDQYATTGPVVDREYVTEIISLFTTLLRGLRTSARSPIVLQECLDQLLSSANQGLDRDRDLIAVVFDILEEELQRQSQNIGQDPRVDLLCACLHFMHVVIPIAPARVWPLLGRTGLLGVEYGSGKLSVIVSNIEAITGRFDFLVSCAKVFEALVDDIICNAVRRKHKKPQTNRFEPSQDSRILVPDAVFSKVLSSFTHHILGAFEASSTWDFAEPTQRSMFNQYVMRSFMTLLDFGFGIQAPSSSIKIKDLGHVTTPGQVCSATNSSSLLAAIMPAAHFVASGFLSNSAGTLRFQPMLRTFIGGMDLQDVTALPRIWQIKTEEIIAALKLTAKLLRVSAHLSTESADLENLVFKVSSLIARLYAVNPLFQLPVVKLLEALITRRSSDTEEPPLLVGCMGHEISQSLLEMLMDFDKPSSVRRLVNVTWSFFSTAISCRQKWFAYFILTGSAPGKQSTTNELGGNRKGTRTVLDIAVDTIIVGQKLSQQEALRALQFLTVAYNFCPWSMNDSSKRKPLINVMLAFLLNFTIPKVPSSELALMLENTQKAACITNILAMYLYRMRETGDTSLASDLQFKWPSEFTQYAMKTDQQTTTYERLKKNFGLKYNGCNVAVFEKTDVMDRDLGDGYCLDREAAHRMLDYDESWSGKGSQNYETEFKAVNIALSIDAAQLALLSAFKILALEISSSALHQFQEQSLIAEVVQECLNANKSVNELSVYSAGLCRLRTDLGLVLMQRLSTKDSSNAVMRAVMSTTWETIRKQGITFESALGTGDATYYRSLLKMLFLGINVHSDKRHSKLMKPGETGARGKTPSFMGEASKSVSVALLILDHIVAIGFRDLAVVIHEDSQDSSPEDVALLTGILQAAIRIPGIEFCHPQILNMMANQDTPRIATNLFSWSDRLAIKGDPIYGELSLLFLFELSSIPLMAEQIAVDGILGHISSANITSYLRRGNVSPFAESAGLQRCYDIWVRGILPLSLNILTSVGASVAGEVALFLEQYPTLLQQASSAFDAAGSSRTVKRSSKTPTKFITLSICAEVHSIALIIYILNGYREQLQGIQEIPKVDWDATKVLGNVEHWLGSRMLLRDRIVPMGKREEQWARMKVGPSGVDNEQAASRLEQKVVGELEGIRNVLGGGGDT